MPDSFQSWTGRREERMGVNRPGLPEAAYIAYYVAWEAEIWALGFWELDLNTWDEGVSESVRIRRDDWGGGVGSHIFTAKGKWTRDVMDRVMDLLL